MSVSTQQGKPVMLVTGGTSGLGLEIVKLFLKRGFYVVTTGRKSFTPEDYRESFRLYRVDFSNLKQTAEVIKTICSDHKFNYVINNAGILSPPGFRLTGDGYEYTFQVNFLAHLLINEIIIGHNNRTDALRIASITSMVHKLANPEMNYCRNKESYSPVKAYSDSKYFLALMCRHLADKYHDSGLSCFALDPGIFGSSIYRTQKDWFRLLYKVASPAMRNAASIAGILEGILLDDEIADGSLYNIRKKIIYPRDANPQSLSDFWTGCYNALKDYLNFKQHT